MQEHKSTRCRRSPVFHGLIVTRRRPDTQVSDAHPKQAAIDHASSLLGHTDKAVTKRVYHRLGVIVDPLK